MKKVSQLTISDFEVNPIWTWADDEEEDLVCPLDRDVLDVGAVFVLSDLRFNNGMLASGFIAVRKPDDQVYLLAVADNLGSFIDIPLNPFLKNLVNKNKLEQEFDVSLDQIFPIRYSTKNYPILGRRYNGKIEKIY